MGRVLLVLLVFLAGCNQEGPLPSVMDDSTVADAGAGCSPAPGWTYCPDLLQCPGGSFVGCMACAATVCLPDGGSTFELNSECKAVCP